MSNWTLKEKSTGDLQVTIDGEEWTKAVDKAFNKICRNVTIDGFRKGQAPKALLERRVSPEEREYQAVEDNANEWMRAALEENNLKPISQPQLKIDSVSPEKAELTFTFAVYPEVTVTEYKGLPYNLKDTEVKDEDVDAEIERMRKTYADLETVDGAAEKGDTVNIDYEGFKDGEPFEGGKAEGYNLELGSGSFIPGFEDQLIGAKAGEEKELHLTFPKDYAAEDLAGKDVVFKVKVNEVKRKVLPELNDDFAADVNMKDVKTVDDLKKAVRERLQDARTSQAEDAAENEMLDALRDKVQADIPDVMIEDEAQNMIQQLAQQLSQYGMSLSNYLQMMGKQADDFKKEYTDRAEKQVKIRLGLEKVAELENLEATDEEVAKAYDDLAQQYNMEADKIKGMISEEMVKENLRNQKAFDFLKENAAKGEAEKAETESK